MIAVQFVSTIMSGPPMLGLKMTNMRICSFGPPPIIDLVEKVKVMTSQDASSYRCNDYLSRRSARGSAAKSHQINDEHECPALMAEDAVDAVCREKMCEYCPSAFELGL